MNGHAPDPGGQRFAIVGIGCRLPGSANDHRAFWRNLAAGQRCVVDTPASRYDAAALVSRDPARPGRLVGGRGGYIDGFDEFDPAFFGIGPREADAMDPQQRKLLEVAWEALEDAGQRPADLAGQRVGVFIGASAVDYQILQFADPSFEQITEHTATGTLMTMVAGRIAACFDFRGPTLVVDTAGSSSLVAVHLACRSLATGESCLALAGGVALELAPQYAIAQTRRGWLSPDGRSRPFAAGAGGWVRAEGAGVVVLKRLAEALRDGDPIHAVILGSGVAHDGRGRGIAVPGGDAEIALIRQVCQDAGLSPGSLQYVEADGASTPTGDSIEASALGAVLADGREPGARALVGSVKSNLGHAGAAAGIAGLIKTVLCLEHEQIAPHIDRERIHPGTELEIPTRLIRWPAHVGPACAGVHAIGLGSHAHVVLEEPPADRRPAARARPGYNLLPLTARDPSAFPAMAAALARELAGDPGPAPAVSDVGYTLARRRQHLEARLSFVYASPADLAELLARYLAGEASPRIVAGRRLDEGRRRLAWVFTGTGPEWWAMGRALLAAEPVYRAVIERCDHAIARFAGWSLLDELAADEAASNMAEPCLAQVASFALQIGLAALWRSLGVRPDAIVGHGAGELAAFHEAGVYSLEDAIQIAIHRSRLSHALVGTGAMLAVGLAPAAAEARIAPVAGRVAIAAIDGPTSVTLSGDRDALDELRAQLAADQVAAQWLPGAIPYHSPAMDRIRDELLGLLADLRPRPAALPLYLTAAEGIAGGPELDAAYWWRNVRDPVRFHAAIDRMISAGCGVFLELGPHPALGGAIADCLAARGAAGRVLPSLRRGEDEPCQIMASLAALHTAGLDIAWDQLYPAGRTVPLPAYPWKRDRYWTEPAAFAQVRLGQREGGGADRAQVVVAADVHSEEGCFPLTCNQTALWVVNQLDPDSCPYHVGRVVAIRARLDPELVFAAVRILIRRHPMLRARIALRDGRPVHRIARDVTADVKLIDIRGWTWADIHAALLREYRRPFDLERDPLFRFRLFQRGDRRFLAMQVAHRIVSDAASTSVFLDELLAVYDALRRGVDPVLPPVPARYLDFVNWQNRLLAGPEADRMLRYWTEHLPAELPALSLPTDRPRPDVQTHHGASQCFVLDSELTARIQTLAHDTGATPFMILLAAYGVLLHRYSGQDDIVVGSPVPGRPHGLAATCGSFANPLPLHVSLAGAPSFLELLDRVRQAVLGALDHQDYPFARLVEELGLPHDPSRPAVFQVMFALPADRIAPQHYGMVLDRVELPEQDGPLDLTLSIREDEPEHALRCVLTYNRDLFDAETVRRLASHYIRLVTAALADPRRPIATLRMLGSAERARIVQRWSGADVAVVPDRPVHAMIRRHAAVRPDALAVIAPGDDGARILSYGELDAAATRLARRLRQLGVGAGDVVAVCLDRSPELVIWLLAILHAGAAYLVVDPADPDDRIAAMIERARARFVAGAIAGRLAGLPGCTRLAVEDGLGANGDPGAPDPAPVAGEASLDRTACVFCTPGPTGQPRAIAITHHGLASAYHAWDVTYRLRSEARVHLQTARAALDRFTGDLVRALCSGGALCLVGEPVVRDIARLYETLVHHAVDTAELTPALARALAAYCLREGKRLDFLRLVVVGPDAWKVEDDRQLRALLGPRSRVLHVYGVTEATIDSAYFEGPIDGLEPDQLVPIGGPFPGSRVFVLDRHGAPVPAGVPGELWVGGNGVAAGYLGDRDATAARFMTVELDDRGPMRLYRTGDIARWDARGTLHAVRMARPDADATAPPAREG